MASVIGPEVGTSVEIHQGGGTLANTTPDAITGMLNLALEKGLSVETLEKLVALHERVSDRAAAQAFVEALTAFRAECPPITKTQENSQFSVTRGGVKRAARYAPLDEIDRVARPVAARHGLVWTWDTRIEGELMNVSCRVIHTMGHAVATNVSMPFGSNAGASPQQKYGSAQTYGMRYSLIAALGIATADEDTDGAAEADPKTITPEEAANLRDLLAESGKNEKKFFGFMGVGSYEEIRASDLRKAAHAINGDRKAEA